MEMNETRLKVTEENYLASAIVCKTFCFFESRNHRNHQSIPVVVLNPSHPNRSTSIKDQKYQLSSDIISKLGDRFENVRETRNSHALTSLSRAELVQHIKPSTLSQRESSHNLPNFGGTFSPNQQYLCSSKRSNRPNRSFLLFQLSYNLLRVPVLIVLPIHQRQVRKVVVRLGCQGR